MILGRVLPFALSLVLVATSSAAAEASVETLAPCEDGAGAAREADARMDLSGFLIAPDASPGTEPLPATQFESWKNLGDMALTDTVGILGAPLHWSARNWLVFGGIAAGVVAVGFAFDYPMRNKTQAHQTQALDDMTKVMEPFGSEYSWAVIGAYGIFGFALHDADAKNIFFDSIMASILASGIITPTLKLVVGRERPNESATNTVFHPFSGSDNAFPSGHATQAFAVASVISAHSDQVWVSVTAYTIAGLVGFSRIYHNAHWTSDVTAGALIGTFVGRGVVAINDRIRRGEGKVSVSFAPLYGDGVKGGAVTVVF
jgi:hypothetical protein